eukprot:CAMPEP_0201488096 /NCGR_PEP_ID=MMETSP0151_2-20130828/16859_1 /ASSEMBLY_ACC=CAM_ASM_000257 /TAXON_ID=200890 /ORGANISM="Paramoeba atlantica, Strain 621/1 / CCAP 1560/9" /LENGTH=451 /DNA_ID=CAMNT_0047873315 /DNA_START=66 /DNA_END=1421 /DNA_ORIENTATION=-
MSKLNEPLLLPCGVSLRNRIAKAAMTEGLADPNTNLPNENHFRLYERWGKSGASFLLTGNVMVDRRYRECPRNVAIDNKTFSPDDPNDILLSLLKRWAQSSKESQLWMQLSHSGRQTPMSVSSAPIAPSPVSLPKPLPGFFFYSPSEMTNEEIEDVIGRFVSAASLVKKAGFDGIQIHGAHGYLISEFLSPRTNKRTDKWGGSLENRSRLLREILEQVRFAVGPSFPICVKMNSADFQRGGFDEEDAVQVIRMLEQQKIDLLEISGGTYEFAAMFEGKPVAAKSTLEREAFFIDFATKVRKLTKTPLMLTGGFRSLRAMRQAVEDGVVDVIGLARPFCLFPEFPKQFLLNPEEEERKKGGGGEMATLALPTISVGIKSVNTGLENLWYQSQMHLIGCEGKDPDPHQILATTSLPLFVSTYICDVQTITKLGVLKIVLVLSCLLALVFALLW